MLLHTLLDDAAAAVLLLHDDLLVLLHGHELLLVFQKVLQLLLIELVEVLVRQYGHLRGGVLLLLLHGRIVGLLPLGGRGGVVARLRSLLLGLGAAVCAAIPDRVLALTELVRAGQAEASEHLRLLRDNHTSLGSQFITGANVWRRIDH